MNTSYQLFIDGVWREGSDGPRAPVVNPATEEAFAEVSWGTPEKEGYRFPFTSAKYPWGSNSNVLNNAIILALAYDFTGDATYLNAVTLAMDYLLGRNAMGQSYVSAYGENSLKYPHHRFWAGQKHNGYPLVPPGAVSGGPNASIQDPVAQGQLSGCVSQKCYIDDLDSWSTNEICINWNAPLAWVVKFLDEQ